MIDTRLRTISNKSVSNIYKMNMHSLMTRVVFDFNSPHISYVENDTANMLVYISVKYSSFSCGSFQSFTPLYISNTLYKATIHQGFSINIFVSICDNYRVIMKKEKNSKIEIMSRDVIIKSKNVIDNIISLDTLQWITNCCDRSICK